MSRYLWILKLILIQIKNTANEELSLSTHYIPFIQQWHPWKRRVMTTLVPFFPKVYSCFHLRQLPWEPLIPPSKPDALGSFPPFLYSIKAFVLLSIWQPGRPTEFQAKDYLKKPCLQKKKNQTRKNMSIESYRNILKARVRFSSTLEDFRTQSLPTEREREREHVRQQLSKASFTSPSARFKEKPCYFAFQ